VAAPKLVVPTRSQYVLITVCTLLLFVFVRQLTDVLLTPLFAAVVAALPVLIVLGPGRVQSVVQNQEVLADKLSLGKVFPEEAEPDESPATGEEVSVRDSVEGKR